MKQSVKLFLLCATAIPIAAQNATAPRSDLQFSLMHCDNSLARDPYNLPDPHGAAARTFNLVALYAPSTNTTQYVSTSFPYTPFAGATNMSAFFWSSTHMEFPPIPGNATLAYGWPQGLLSIQIPSTSVSGRLKTGVYAGKVLFEEVEYQCVTEYGSGMTGGGPRDCGSGFCASWAYCAARYMCKQWETPVPTERVCGKHDVSCFPLWEE
ncbi:hypothetical protein BU26DRAFT_606974 [Trematosphaeria pertusa]|uniref:Uncharacterized protein n=1 Tax=Trematosphaeria pertusa TaxID=390896 RepID=A0A6A6I8U3_9PLEO|nr:uncharacterized protein BU26DRAFT_606974 [Trematosphaeria pertusa]KAF2246786.1 hypothetical protein BU26DRAFT_606974 [Trematosphaeria pertusa]